MIELTHGNLLDAEADALVNTVNCVGVMGKGLALQFKQAFPENFRVYERACRAGEVRPGHMLTVSTGKLSGPKYIVNFPTKRHWKGSSRIEDIDAGLHALAQEIHRLGIKSVAVPPLGCGNGGLCWEDVRPRIEAALEQLPEVRVLLYGPAPTPVAAAMKINTDRPEMTRGRALLLALLERYAIPGYEHTKLEVQKLAYFLHIAGDLEKLRFVKHHYGPYAENLNHVLQRIEGHFIRGYGDRSSSGRAEIVLLPGAMEAAQRALAGDHVARARLERVGRLIEGFETPHGMELLATVHWVATHELEAAERIDAVIEGVARWNERKRQRFQPSHIHKAWERLRAQGWLEITAGDPPATSEGVGGAELRSAS